MSFATSSGKKPKKGGKAKKGSGNKGLTNKNGDAMLLKRGSFLANLDENELSQTAVWQKRGKVLPLFCELKNDSLSCFSIFPLKKNILSIVGRRSLTLLVTAPHSRH